MARGGLRPPAAPATAPAPSARTRSASDTGDRLGRNNTRASGNLRPAGRQEKNSTPAACRPKPASTAKLRPTVRRKPDASTDSNDVTLLLSYSVGAGGPQCYENFISWVRTRTPGDCVRVALHRKTNLGDRCLFPTARDVPMDGGMRPAHWAAMLDRPSRRSTRACAEARRASAAASAGAPLTSDAGLSGPLRFDARPALAPRRSRRARR